MSSLGSVSLGSRPKVFLFTSLTCHRGYFRAVWVLLARLLRCQQDPSVAVPLPSHDRDTGRWRAFRGNIMLPSMGLFQVPVTCAYVNGKKSKESLK